MLLLLLLAVGTAAAPHVNFLHFSQNGKPPGVQSAIGYPIEVLEYAWSKYGSRLIRAVYRYPGFRVVARSRNRLKLGERVAEALYNGLYWIHHYPSIAGAAWPTKRLPHCQHSSAYQPRPARPDRGGQGEGQGGKTGAKRHVFKRK